MLDVGGNRISRLGGLAGLHSLRVLKLDSNSIVSIEALAVSVS